MNLFKSPKEVRCCKSPRHHQRKLIGKTRTKRLGYSGGSDCQRSGAGYRREKWHLPLERGKKEENIGWEGRVRPPARR
uniref:Putative ovule protein n=1 Tax=Solanum chacoense TaxID=4108 RepID=A0A0V0H6U1_SOLCH